MAAYLLKDPHLTQEKDLVPVAMHSPFHQNGLDPKNMKVTENEAVETNNT